MKIYRNDGLTQLQHFHRSTLCAPQGGLCHWAVKKIEFYEDKETIAVDFVQARILKRVIAVAMPVFALLDTLHYGARAAGNLLSGNTAMAGMHAKRMGGALRMVVCAPLAALPGAVFPIKVFLTAERWQKKRKEQVSQSIESAYKSGLNRGLESKAAFEKALHGIEKRIIADGAALKTVREIHAEMVFQVPWGQDRENSIREEYIELSGMLLVEAATKELRLDEAPQAFLDLSKEILRLKKPKTRLSIWKNLLDQFRCKPEVIKHWQAVAQKGNLKNEKLIALFQILQLPAAQPEELEKQAVELLSESKFGDSIKVVKLIATLSDLLEKEGLPEKLKMEVFNRLLDAYKADKDSLKQHEEWTKAKKPSGALKKLLKEKGKLLSRKGLLEHKGCQNEAQEKELQGLPAKIEELQKKIEQLEPKNASGSQAVAYKGSLYYTLQALTNLGVLLSLDKRELIEACLDAIGPAEHQPFKLLSDEKLINFVFKKEFQIDGLPDNIGEKLENWCSPSVLIVYHARLKELTGMERTKALNAYYDFIRAAFDDKLSALRHDEKKNPHLNHIFKKFPELRAGWCQFPSLKVQDILPDAKKANGGYILLDTENPIDLLMQGSEIGNSCLDLNGRLERLHGLLGMVMDGKTHTILIKDETGKVAAKTRLILLWDKKAKKPVLFLDQIDARTAAEGDTDLQEALKKFAQKRAEELGLELVTIFGENNERHKCAGPKYKGSVVSLGSNAPTEYVNVLIKNKTGPYSLGPVFKVV